MSRMTRRHLATTVLALAGLASFTTVGSVMSQSDEPSDYEIAMAVQFRDHFGFEYSERFVRETFANPKEFPNDEWGIPLSTEEATDIAGRLQRRPLYQEAIDEALASKDSGGVYVDQGEGGVPHFLFSRAIANHSEEIGRLVPKGLPYVVSKVDAPLSDLRSLANQVAEDWESLQRDGIDLVSVAPRVSSNSVIVGLARADDEALSLLRERYGPLIATKVVGRIVADACDSRRDCDNPI